MDKNSIKKIIEKPELQQGVEKYLEIMSLLPNVDVSANHNFQRKYNGFYRMGRRNPEYYDCYYNYMEKQKNNNITFKDTLAYLYNSVERYEASFSSKLVATLKPTMPIWDKFVLENIGLVAPAYGTRDRMNKIIDVYSKIVDWYEKYLNTDDAKFIIKLFDEKIGQQNITNLKKIDFVLWQMRD